MKQLELFAGVGGFGLAGEWAGIETICQVEIDAFCRSVLKKNFPHAHRHDDIHTFDGHAWRGRVDIVSGGFPCQPYSHAGQRRGNDDDRALWPEMLRVIRETEASWFVGENVAGLLSMDGGRVFAGIVADLESLSYSIEAFVIPACAVGAPHRRDRVWIVAHRNSDGQQQPGWPLKKSGDGLQTAVKNALLPTPTAQDSKNATLPQSQALRDSVPGAMIRTFLLRTPDASLGKSGDYGADRRWQRGKQLNLATDISDRIGRNIGYRLQPDFVEWMMGFPEGWTELEEYPPMPRQKRKNPPAGHIGSKPSETP